MDLSLLPPCVTAVADAIRTSLGTKGDGQDGQYEAFRCGPVLHPPPFWVERLSLRGEVCFFFHAESVRVRFRSRTRRATSPSPTTAPPS